MEKGVKIMTEYDYWKIFPRMPKKVTLGDITVRDGFQHLEKFVSTRAKIFYAEEMIFAGCFFKGPRGHGFEGSSEIL